MARSKRSSGRNYKRSSRRRRSMRRRRQSGGSLQMLGGGEKRNVHWQNFFNFFIGGLNIYVVDGAWKLFLLKLGVCITLFIALTYINNERISFIFPNGSFLSEISNIKLSLFFIFVLTPLIFENILSVFERHDTGKIRPGHFFGIEIFKGIKPTQIDRSNWTRIYIISLSCIMTIFFMGPIILILDINNSIQKRNKMFESYQRRF